jgi:hypothetical protein
MNAYRPRCAARSITRIVTRRFLFLILGLVPFAAVAQDIRKLDPEVDQLVASDAKLERIATGFNKWTEGPVWTHKGTLLFAEIPAFSAFIFRTLHPRNHTGVPSFFT